MSVSCGYRDLLLCGAGVGQEVGGREICFYPTGLCRGITNWNWLLQLVSNCNWVGVLSDSQSYDEHAILEIYLFLSASLIRQIK